MPVMEGSPPAWLSMSSGNTTDVALLKVSLQAIVSGYVPGEMSVLPSPEIILSWIYVLVLLMLSGNKLLAIE